MKARTPFLLLPLLAILLILTTVAPSARVDAAPTTITVYKSQYPVDVSGAYQPSQWADTPTITDPTSGMTFAVKQNGTGWLFLMVWNQSQAYCYDAGCFGGIELANLSNSFAMGSPSSPTIMILTSTSFKGSVDEFVSKGEQTPSTVESLGYRTQSVCGLNVSGGQYTAQCYRPFTLTDASPYDFPTLGPGSTIEIGFAVGEFTSPGDHAATDMTAYVLTFSNQTYTPSVSSSTTSVSQSASANSTSVTTVASTSSSTTASTTISPPAGPNVLYYALELATIVVGFSLIILIVLWRYPRG